MSSCWLRLEKVHPGLGAREVIVGMENIQRDIDESRKTFSWRTAVALGDIVDAQAETWKMPGIFYRGYCYTNVLSCLRGIFKHSRAALSEPGNRLGGRGKPRSSVLQIVQQRYINLSP